MGGTWEGLGSGLGSRLGLGTECQCDMLIALLMFPNA